MTAVREMRGGESPRSGGAPAQGLDWEAVAALLAENDPRPLLVVDRSGHIRLANAALEELLGRGRGAASGRRWSELFSSRGGVELGQGLPDAVLRGTLRRLPCESVTPGGPHLRLFFELSLLGRGEDAGVLAVVTSVTHLEGAREAEGGAARLYVICSRLQDFGTIRSAYAHGTRQPDLEGQRCYQVMHQRASPCAGCPVLAGAQEGWPRTAVFRCPEGESRFQVITAEPQDADHVRLSVRPVSDGLFRQLVQAKVEALAVTGGLSEREHRVFLHLVDGLEFREIGERLGISVRTVKFHQANIFRKLAVDSRAALLSRLL